MPTSQNYWKDAEGHLQNAWNLGDAQKGAIMTIMRVPHNDPGSEGLVLPDSQK